MPQSQRFLSYLSLLLLLPVLIILVFFVDSADRWPLIIAGLSAALMEIFYENAGVVGGAWQFNESSMKIGGLSVEMLPIASTGTLFSCWVGLFLESQNEILQLTPWIALTLSLSSLVLYSWIVFIKKIKLETLWLVFPLFSFAISLVASEIALLMLGVFYISSMLETVLLKSTKAYTYLDGYKPAATSLGYVFFVIFCFVSLVSRKYGILPSLILINQFILPLLIIGLVFSIAIILIISYKRQTSK